MPAWVQTGFDDYYNNIPAHAQHRNRWNPRLQTYQKPSPGTWKICHHRRRANSASAPNQNSAANGANWFTPDVRGKIYQPKRLAAKVGEAMQLGDDMAFVIGGADGISKGFSPCDIQMVVVQSYLAASARARATDGAAVPRYDHYPSSSVSSRWLFLSFQSTCYVWLCNL